MTSSSFFQLLEFTTKDLLALKPLFGLTALALVTLLAGTFKGETGRRFAFGISVVGLLVVLFGLVEQLTDVPDRLVAGFLVIDGFSVFFSIIVVAATLMAVLMNFGYDRREGLSSDAYGLLCFGAVGMILLSSTFDLIFLFIAMEIMSLATYVLVGMRRRDQKSSEAAMKYFILGGVAAAVFLFGTAFMHGFSGSTNLLDIREAVATSPGNHPFYLLGGILVLVGFLFKVGSFPFQVWVPDVYEGAPNSITAFMTSAVKAAAFAAFLRISGELFLAEGLAEQEIFLDLLRVVAVLTMLLGNLVALVQTNLKRMLAFSTIAHTGYLLIGMVAIPNSESGLASMLFYLLVYTFMSLGAFAVLSLMSRERDESLDLDDFAGLGYREPLLGVALTIFLLGLAGIPPTGGFLGKYYLFNSAIQAGEIPLAVIGVLASAISLYYYLRVIVWLYMKESISQARGAGWTGALFTAVFAMLITMQLGLFPGGLIDRLTQILKPFGGMG